LRLSRLHGRTLRTSIALSVAVTALAMLGALGGVGFAKGSATAAQYQYGKDKVVICHKGKTLKVAKPALKGHVKHGDALGACASDKRKGKNKDQAKQKHDEKQKAKGDDAAGEPASKTEREEEKAKEHSEKAREHAEKAKEHAEKAKEHAEKAKHEAEARAAEAREKAQEQAAKRAEHEAEKAEREAEKAKEKEKGRRK
jgi:hypothetical protein